MKVACQKTYATLCIYSDTEPRLVDVIKEHTGLTASRAVENKQRSFSGFQLPRYGWFLTSKDALDSLEVADHIRWICQKLEKPGMIAEIRNKYEVRLLCFWSSDGGGGGPSIPKDVMEALVRLGLDLEFDLYLGSEETRH
jgi:hypothetical protein